MKSVNFQMLLALVIHVLITLNYQGVPDYNFLAYFLDSIVLFNVIGLLIIASGRKILGARIFMISSAILVPIGLIGAFGARKVIDEVKKKNFHNKNQEDERGKSIQTV